MKLRIRGNSLRLRVTRTELADLMASGAIEEGTQFAPGMQLTYCLKIDDAGKEMTARMDGNGVTVTLPAASAEHWATSDSEVSLAHEQRVGDAASLRILVEKDFACLVDREGEDDSDAFPHPEAGAC